jgi:hypothetical protein
MLSLTIEDKNIENIFLKEFHSDKVEFFNFIKSSFDKFKDKNIENNDDLDFTDLQIDSMSKTWDNDQDKAWDDL